MNNWKHDFKVGDQVLFTVFPHFRLIPGRVVKGGIVVIDDTTIAELENNDVSTQTHWDNIDEAEIYQPSVKRYIF